MANAVRLWVLSIIRAYPAQTRAAEMETASSQLEQNYHDCEQHHQQGSDGVKVRL
jgi:hypothetical protein